MSWFVVSFALKHFGTFEAIPARSVLRSYLPYVSQFYATEDVRQLCLDIIPKRYPLLSNAKFLRRELVDGFRKEYFTYRFDSPGMLITNPMRWFNGLVQIGAILLNTPRYEKIEYKACQTSFVEASPTSVITKPSTTPLKPLPVSVMP